MFSVQSLILMLLPVVLFVCVTCRSRSVDSHTTRVSGLTERPKPNGNCSCKTEIRQSSTTIRYYTFESFPVFGPLKLKNTNLNLYVDGTFGELPSECISPLIGEGTVANLEISGNAPYPYTELQVDSNAFSTDYVNSIKVTFTNYAFSFFSPEALTNVLSVGFYYCRMTVISNNSFYGFDGNELTLWDSGIEKFEQYAFNGTGTLDTVRIEQNPFSRIDAAFKLIRTKTLDLTDNNIATIPDYALCECNVLSGCANIIQTLTLSYNPLVAISDLAFANLPGLTSLNMVNCLLVKIPTIVINAVRSLIEINLSNNLITEVEPNSFVYLINLKKLYLYDNPIISIKPEAFNGLLWVILDISYFDGLKSVDAAVTYGMNKVFDLIIYNCSKFDEITLNNYTQLPDSLNSISASSLNIKRISSNLDLWLQLTYSNYLDISNNYNYNCVSDIRWMSKYVFCPHRQIVMDNTLCADTDQLLKAYLQQLEPNPICIQHSLAT